MKPQLNAKLLFRFHYGLINKSEILKSAKDAYHKFMWIFIFKIYNNIVAQVNSELFKISCADPKKFTRVLRDILVCLGGPRHLFCMKFYYVNLRNYKLDL